MHQEDLLADCNLAVNGKKPFSIRGSTKTATLLPNGTVLIVGGNDNPTAEIYNPVTGTFTTTGKMSVGRAMHTATLLKNGKLLITGGSNTGSTNPLDSAELYDPAQGTSTTTGTMTEKRVWHTATLRQDGKVLIAGGTGGPDGSVDGLITAELYDQNHRNLRKSYREHDRPKAHAYGDITDEWRRPDYRRI